MKTKDSREIRQWVGISKKITTLSCAFSSVKMIAESVGRKNSRSSGICRIWQLADEIHKMVDLVWFG